MTVTPNNTFTSPHGPHAQGHGDEVRPAGISIGGRRPDKAAGHHQQVASDQQRHRLIVRDAQHGTEESDHKSSRKRQPHHDQGVAEHTPCPPRRIRCHITGHCFARCQAGGFKGIVLRSLVVVLGHRCRFRGGVSPRQHTRPPDPLGDSQYGDASETMTGRGVAGSPACGLPDSLVS